MMDNPSPHTLGFPLFTSQLRTRVSVKRVFTPYDLPLVKQGELTELNKTASLPSSEKRTRTMACHEEIPRGENGYHLHNRRSGSRTVPREPARVHRSGMPRGGARAPLRRV